ncbi:MAG: TetR family transcriptional regulator, partial [Trebonia sp.]
MHSLVVDARERPIESTRELFWERGYVGTSPRAIQQRSGAGQGSMYYDEDEHVFAALRGGASGFVLKDSPPEKVLDVATGEAPSGDGMVLD